MDSISVTAAPREIMTGTRGGQYYLTASGKKCYLSKHVGVRVPKEPKEPKQPKQPKEPKQPKRPSAPKPKRVPQKSLLLLSDSQDEEGGCESDSTAGSTN
jgi:hypothetical protein